MNIENRVIKLEERFGVNKAPETLEGMIKKFEAGEYGLATMSVAAHMLLSDSFEKLKERLPDALIS